MKKSLKKLTFPNRYEVLAADLSLKRPGFCVVQYEDGKIINVTTSCVDNKTKTKPHGVILNEIYNTLKSLIKNDENQFLVREKAFNGRGAMSEIGIFKVVGIADFCANEKEWSEIYPVSVKKLVTGYGTSTKEQVALSLVHYVGSRTYNNDDLSDATAVAIAFLLQNNQIEPYKDVISNE